MRFGRCFVNYLTRSVVTRRNFILITHADCVAVCCNIFPKYFNLDITRVDYCGHFVIQREEGDVDSRHTSVQSGDSGSKCPAAASMYLSPSKSGRGELQGNRGEVCVELVGELQGSFLSNFVDCEDSCVDCEE